MIVGRRIPSRQKKDANMKITKIVVTGGPCAGKTTAMSWIQNAFVQLGYVVLFVPETATELITGGVAPWTAGTNGEYQKCQMKLQLQKEEIFLYAAKTMKADKILIVCDRGAMDNKAYMNEEEAQAVYRYVGKSEKELREDYDAVFHLVTAAKGAEKFYTTANNSARTETVEEAAALDDRIISCWMGHPHLRIIDNSVEFQIKLKRLISEIASFLGEDMPFEKERRFLIKMPSPEFRGSVPATGRIEIVQTYLAVNNNVSEVRLRDRDVAGAHFYYQTMKRKSESGQIVEIEKRLSKEEYLELLWEEDPSKDRIRKKRYCIEYEGCYYEIDAYPFWEDKAILIVALGPSDGKIPLPPEIEVIKEITDDPEWDNAAIAHKR